jgi:endoglucanase
MHSGNLNAHAQPIKQRETDMIDKLKIALYLALGALHSTTAAPFQPPVPPPDSPVARHGQLRVEGTQLIDQHGEPIQLRGISAAWINWFGDFANPDLVNWLREDWNIDVYRIPMAVEAENGYLTHPDEMLAKVDLLVETCAKLGIYVIIDYHSHKASDNTEAAERFFDRMSAKYGHLPNVFYEIWNEPEEVSWIETIRPYSERVVNVIRKNDKKNIILAGTPRWSSLVHHVAEAPLDDKNTMYVLHFYSGTHRQHVRDDANEALSKGIPIFVTEFGVSHHDGGGNEDREVYLCEADTWIDWMDQNKISWVNWTMCDKNEASAFLRPGASRHGNWLPEDLTEAGIYIRQKLKYGPNLPQVK